jgi:TATA-binding protein-associated factor
MYFTDVLLIIFCNAFSCLISVGRFRSCIQNCFVAGCVLNLMSREGVNGVLKILLQLLTHSEWEARHGGLLGLKYLLAVREVMVTLLWRILLES